MGIKKVRHNGQWVEFSTGTSSSGSGGGSGSSSDPVGTIVIWAGSAASIPTDINFVMVVQQRHQNLKQSLVLMYLT